MNPIEEMLHREEGLLQELELHRSTLAALSTLSNCLKPRKLNIKMETEQGARERGRE